MRRKELTARACRTPRRTIRQNRHRPVTGNSNRRTVKPGRNMQVESDRIQRSEEVTGRRTQFSPKSSPRTPSDGNRNILVENEDEILQTPVFRRYTNLKKSISKCLGMFLALFAVLEMMSGMVFAAIHVVLTIADAEATDDLQVPLPIYLSAVLVSVFGLVELVVTKVRNAYVALFGIFLSITACIVTLTGLLSVGTIALPKYHSYVHFQYDASRRCCMAFTRWDRKPSGYYKDGTMYYNLSSCSLIESTLPPLIYSLVIFYGISCLVSFISCFIQSALLCLPGSSKETKTKRKSNKRSSGCANASLELTDMNESDLRNVVQFENQCRNRDILYKPNTQPYYTVPYRLPGTGLTPYSTTQDRNETLCHPIPDYSMAHDRGRRCGCNTVRLCRSSTAVTSTSIGRPSIVCATVATRAPRSADSTIPFELFSDQSEISFRQQPSHNEHRRQEGGSEYVRRESLSPNRGERSGRRRENIRAPTRHRGRRRSAGPAIGRCSPPPYSELPKYDDLEHSPERSYRCSSGLTSPATSNTETLL